MQPNLILPIIKEKTRTKQPMDRPMLRKDAHVSMGWPSGSPLAPLVRRAFSVGGESKVATVPPVVLVIESAEFGPFGLNPCLPGLYTGGVGYTAASTHWFGT